MTGTVPGMRCDETDVRATPDVRADAAWCRTLVSYAVRAPSVHNSQPWKFAAAGESIELRADRSRRLAVADPQDRELTISCGAALFHLRVALRHFGYAGDVELLPDPDDADLLARVRRGAPRAPTWDDERLFGAIPTRHTARGALDERPLPPELVFELYDAAREEGAWLRRVSGGNRVDLADLIADGDRRQWADAAFRREIASWVRPSRSARRDGLPGYALGVGAFASRFMPALLRRLNRGPARAARDARALEGAPVVLVVATSGDTPRDWLAAGQALDHLLLRAAAEGLSASYFNQALELPDLRRRVGSVLGRRGYAQVVLRLGYAAPTVDTPRRGVSEVLDSDSPTTPFAPPY